MNSAGLCGLGPRTCSGPVREVLLTEGQRRREPLIGVAPCGL